MDCRPATRDGQSAVKWTWEGNDEVDPAQVHPSFSNHSKLAALSDTFKIGVRQVTSIGPSGNGNRREW
jgi:hypothetical protein